MTFKFFSLFFKAYLYCFIDIDTYVDEHVCAYASVYANDRVTGQCSRQDCASQLGVLETRFGEYQSFFESLSCSEVLMLRM